MNNLVKEIECIIGYKFTNTDLLIRAFTHASFANEHNVEDYERLEFLGDSLLQTLVTDYLYHHFDNKEGDLSKIRAKIVSAPSLHKVVKDLGLNKYIRVGGSIGKAKLSHNIVADVFESIVGAIYLDSNMDNASKFVTTHLIVSIDNIMSIVDALKDYKTMLQEALQAVGKHAEYIAKECRIDNDIAFKVSLVIDGKIVATDVASSKKLGEHACAKKIMNNSGGVF